MKQKSLLLLALLIFVWGCPAWGEVLEPPTAQPVPHQPVAPLPHDVSTAPVVHGGAESTSAGYRYDPVGRRDPFASLLDVQKGTEEEEVVPLTPLQQFEIGQLRLLGVIVGKGEPRAMVLAPDGKSYILKRGVKVGKQDGAVVDINQDGVLIEERYVDFSGEVLTGTQEIALPKRQGVE